MPQSGTQGSQNYDELRLQRSAVCFHVLTQYKMACRLDDATLCCCLVQLERLAMCSALCKWAKATRQQRCLLVGGTLEEQHLSLVIPSVCRVQHIN